MYIFSTEFLNNGASLWSPSILDEMFSKFNGFKSSGDPESSEKILKDFIFEVSTARREFMSDMQELHMIMKCRAKCDKDSHFGGQECAKLMKKIGMASDKYLRISVVPIIQGSVSYFIDKIRKKARQDEGIARKFEMETKQYYLTYGKDNTLDIFRKSGYII